MKYIFLFLLPMLTVLTSCNKDDLDISTNTEVATKQYLIDQVNRLNWGAVGEAHNQGLDLIFEDAKDNENPVDGSTRTKIGERIAEIMNDNYGTNFTHEANFPNHFEFVLDMNMEEKADHLRSQGFEDETIYHVFNIYKALTLTNAKQTVDMLIELEAVTIDNEAANLLYQNSLDIAKASIHYWTHNLDKWQHEIITTNNQFPSVEFRQTWDAAGTAWFWETVNTMGRNDVGGGILGTLGVTNTTSSLLAVIEGTVEAGWAVAGALYTSGGTGLYSVFLGPGCPSPSTVGGGNNSDPSATHIDYCWGVCTWELVFNQLVINCPCN